MNKPLFKKIPLSQIEWSLLNKEVFFIDYKTGFIMLNIKTIRKLSAAIELMGYKVVKKSVIYIGKEIDVVNL
jgi:hypothetical protein